MLIEDFLQVEKLQQRKLFKFLLQKEVTDQIVPTENNGRIASHDNSEFFLSHQIELRIHPKIIRYLSYNEKIRIYTLIRILSLLPGGGVYGIVLMDLTSLLKSRLSENSKEFFRLSKLSDKEFLEEIEATLKPGSPNRRAFFREINSSILINKNRSFLKEIIPNYLRMDYVCLTKKKKKRRVYRKGHTDHGSLGNTDHTLLREEGEYIYRTEILPEEIKNRVQHEVHLLLGDVQGEAEKRRLSKKF